jgi:hypothetical protein
VIILGYEIEKFTSIDVRPIKNWSEADMAEIGMETIGEWFLEWFKPIPIKRIRFTPAWITVRSEQFEKGVVILNQKDPPNDDDPIPLPFHFSTKKRILDLKLEKDDEWPTGFVVLFMDKEKLKLYKKMCMSQQ